MARRHTVPPVGRLASQRLVGQRFGKLVCVAFEYRKSGNLFFRWRCDCGAEKVLARGNVASGRTKDCGCIPKSAGACEPTHGMAKTREYRIWKAMRHRCSMPTLAIYRYYGAKGVRVCERWDTSFEAFYEDMGPANGLTIDRINPFGNYEPGNCRWATVAEQAANKRIHHPELNPERFANA